MIHKMSHTFVTDLAKDSYFGELGVLKEEPRCLSARAREFTEAYTLNKEKFYRISENYMKSI